MASSSIIFKYLIGDASGSLGTQPFKEKAKIEGITEWQFTDKLNELKTFTFVLQNDEFGKANAKMERQIMVPFIERFKGIITDRQKLDDRITVICHELAWHFTRRLFSHNGDKRVSYTDVNWYNANWKYRKVLSTNREMVSDTLKQIPIPVIFSSDEGLKTHALSSANDILFTEKDGVTKIPHEIEKYDSATGELIAWVKLPTLSESSDTKFYLYYGNPNSSDQRDTINVWKETNLIRSGTVSTTFDYAMIQHLGNDPSGGAPQYLDSTENNNDGTQTGGVTRVVGQIGDGAEFDAVDDKIDCGSGATVDDIFKGVVTNTLTFNTGFIATSSITLTGFVRAVRLDNLPVKGAIMNRVGIEVFSAAGNVRVKVYEDVNGLPGDLISESNSIAASSGMQYYQLNTLAAIPKNGSVWVAFECDSDSLDVVGNRFDVPLGTTMTISHTYGTGPDPFGSGTASDVTFNLAIEILQDVEISTIDSGGVVTGWIEPDSDGEGDLGRILDKVGMYIRTFGETNGNMKMRFFRDFDGNNGEWDLTNAIIPINKKTFFAVYYNDGSPANEPVIFINDTKLTVGSGLTETTTPTGAAVTDGSSALIIGNNTGQTATFDGLIDEVQCLKGAIPPNIDDVIKTHYNITSNPLGFITRLAEEQYVRKVNEIAQQIIDSANADMPSGMVWTLDDRTHGVVPTKHLITHINFDDNVRDQIGTNHGTWTGLEQYTRTKLGKGGLFNGFSRVTLANEGNFDTEDEIVISFWMSIPSTNTTAFEAISKMSTNNTAGYDVRLASGVSPRFRLINTDTTNELDVTTSKNIADGTLHHVVCTVGNLRTAADLDIYIDSVLDENPTVNVDNLTGSILNNVAVNIAGFNDGSSLAPSGVVIDGVRIYIGKKANQEDVDALYIEGLSEIAMQSNYKNHYEAFQELARTCGCDIFFDNQLFKVNIRTKGKVIDNALDVRLSLTPQESLGNYANQVDLIGKVTDRGVQLTKEVVSEDSPLRYNYEKLIADQQLTTDQQLTGVANGLINEFSQFTPVLSGTLPTDQFKRLDLKSGDVAKLVNPIQDISGSFRIMELNVTQQNVSLALEPSTSGGIRARSLSLKDVINGILKKLDDTNIEAT